MIFLIIVEPTKDVIPVLLDGMIFLINFQTHGKFYTCPVGRNDFSDQFIFEPTEGFVLPVTGMIFPINFRTHGRFYTCPVGRNEFSELFSNLRKILYRSCWME